jgi:alpha-L-fucosidase
LNEKAFPQLEELLTRYGPVSLIWFDCGHKVTDEQGSRFVELVRGLQPDCLVNSRVRRPGFGDYINSGDNQVQMQPGKQGRDWESIHTMNRSWGYKRNDNDWKTSRSILENMIDVFSQNGNYLLNVGPPADGEFDEQSVRLLTEIGRWMKLNGDAVYGSEGSPIGKPQWGRCTRKGSTLYLHVFDWPKSGELVVQGVRSQVAKAYALVDDTRQPLPFARLNDQDIGITVGSTAPTAMIPVIVLEIGGVLDTSPVRLLHPKDYINVFGAFDGRLKGNGPLRFDTGKKDRDVVKDWSDTGDSIVWTFRSSGSGLYRVTIIYGADNDSEGGQFTVESAGQVLTGTVKASGDAYHFAPHWLGMFEIPQAGDYELRVRAQTIPRRSLMHLQKVELEAAGRDVNDVVY